MTETKKFYDDDQFERLLRYFHRRKDRGVEGLVDRVQALHEARSNVEPDRFDRFCERAYIRNSVERDLLLHFGNRLEVLHSVIGDQMYSHCVLQVLLLSHEDFEKVVRMGFRCRDPDARSLVRDLTDALESRLEKLKPGEPDIEVWGMYWSANSVSEGPSLEAQDSAA